MNSLFRSVGLLAGLALLERGASGQSNVVTDHKYCWSENIGFLNWRDAGQPATSQGARVRNSILSGFIWAENVGYINLGDGTPTNGTSYANANGSDFGVNRNPATNGLSGLAWGENIGWINFNLPTLPANQRPRVDPAAGRLRGYAWGENIGWINLDNATVYIGVTLCTADFNDDTFVNSQDVFDFLSAFFPLQPSADINHDGFINSQDFFDFIAAFFAGC